MARQSTPQTRLADSALRILAKKPWREVALAEVARAAKVPLAELPLIAPAKPALVSLILRRFGDDLAAHYKSDRKTQSAHERLFDVSMAWFDCLARHRPAMRSLYDGLKRDPLTLLDMRGAIVAAAQWLMALAEADKGPALSLRAAAFAAILGRAIPVWLDDDADSTKTMARLDGDLGRMESWLGKL
jgi:AcrR family transcriptional regulator